MAKNAQSGYTLKCPGCGHVVNSPFKSAICVRCGGLALVPPLTDGAFEKVAEGEDGTGTKPETKPAKDTSDRPAESGGRAF